MNLSPQAERALCAYLTQVMLNDEASHHTAAHLSSRPTHINPGSDPYLPLSFDLQDVPTLPDWLDEWDEFDHPDYL